MPSSQLRYGRSEMASEPSCELVAQEDTLPDGTHVPRMVGCSFDPYGVCRNKVGATAPPGLWADVLARRAS
jgi:hypothetical protein